MIVIIRSLLFCLFIAHFSYAVDYDYFFGSLRSKKNCTSIKDKLDCQIKCGADTGMCIGNKCYCLTVSKLKEYGFKDGQIYYDVYDNDELPEIEFARSNADQYQDEPEYLDETLLYDKQILRHHIAHFCPNLDIARDCIRTCMKEGKPAFCGKDHVCYCGHRYSDKDRDSKANAESVYSQFKDLYEKYFGPNHKPQIQV